MSGPGVVFENVSRFYGDVLGINGVNLTIPPGITSLVGPNGSGKTTLMNLMTGLLRPSRGRVQVLDLHPDDPEAFGRKVGYCWRLVAPAPPWDWSGPYMSPSLAYRAAIDHLVFLAHQGEQLVERAVGQ